MHHATLQSQVLSKDFFVVLGVSLILGISAWVSIPLPLTPVPISFTCQLAILFAVFLGKRGALGVLAYFIEGAMGLPVFSMGRSGIVHLLGPTGGYLVGFVLAAFAVAYIMEQMKEKTPAKVFGVMLLGNALVYIFGLPHLALLIGWTKALALGCVPFIAGDLLKLIIGSKTLKKLNFFS